MSKHRRRRRHRSLRRSAQPGSPPGIVAAQESARPSCVTAISYGPNEIDVFEDAAVPQVIALHGTRPVLWVHIEGIKDTVLIRELGEAFSLHGSALEDAVTHHQHVKVPLGFIAGLYGMNFNTQNSPFNMPELNWYFGYPFALAVMFAEHSEQPMRKIGLKAQYE